MNILPKLILLTALPGLLIGCDDDETLTPEPAAGSPVAEAPAAEPGAATELLGIHVTLPEGATLQNVVADSTDVVMGDETIQIYRFPSPASAGGADSIRSMATMFGASATYDKEEVNDDDTWAFEIRSAQENGNITHNVSYLYAVGESFYRCAHVSGSPEAYELARNLCGNLAPRP